MTRCATIENALLSCSTIGTTLNFPEDVVGLCPRLTAAERKIETKLDGLKLRYVARVLNKMNGI